MLDLEKCDMFCIHTHCLEYKPKMNARIALCPDVAKVKHDIGTNVVLNSKIQDYEILPELD